MRSRWTSRRSRQTEGPLHSEAVLIHRDFVDGLEAALDDGSDAFIGSLNIRDLTKRSPQFEREDTKSVIASPASPGGRSSEPLVPGSNSHPLW
jgi:hypothetical protein